MRERVPAVIVSLPAATVAEAKAAIREAAGAGADLAEVRFDRWAPDERARAHELFPAALPLVATLRSRAEGGAGPDDPRERARVLSGLAGLGFRWVDLEAARDLTAGLDLPSPERLGRIVSVHRLTPVTPEEWGRLVREPASPGSVRKVVVPASVLHALTALIPRLPPPGEAAPAAMTTGPSGPILRALSKRLGLPFVFAALPEADGTGGRTPVEPGQIPVDRLRPFLSATDTAPLFAVAGHPVAHSRSPALHHRWMRASGRVGLYVALDFTSEEEFVESLAPLAEWGFHGLNVTHPLKRPALEAATEVGPGAKACGVANCLTLRDGEVEAENTDLAAILRRLTELREAGRWDGRSLSVLGTGGAARATLAAARTLGTEARVYGRKAERANALAERFAARAVASERAEPDQLLVHATEVGRTGAGPLDLPLERILLPGTHVVDWVYDPDEPELRERTLRAGATYEDGRRLLVYQAAASFGLWWGEEPGAEEVARTLAEVGCAG